MTALHSFPGLLSDFPRGTTVPLRFDIVDTEGTAIDVTGGKVYLRISKRQDGDTADLIVELNPTTPAEGLFTGRISDTETLSLEHGEYFYSLKFIDSSDDTYTFDMGQIDVFICVHDRIAQ